MTEIFSEKALGAQMAEVLKSMEAKEDIVPQFIPLDNPPLKEVNGKIKKTPAQLMMSNAKMVKTLTLQNISRNENPLISLTVASNARRIKALKLAASEPVTQFSVNLDLANEVEPNIIYQIAGLTENVELLVKVSTPGISKLSSVIQFDASVVVETLVFTVDENNNATVIVDSVNMLSDFDIVSFLPNGGVYYVLYTVYAGGGNAAVYLPSSTSHSINEPNDSPFQAPLYNTQCYFIDTFDNNYDTDVVRIKQTTPEPVAISISLNGVDLSGQVNFGIYYKEDENGNAVDQWIVYGPMTIPVMGMLWNNTTLKGEFYIYVQYLSGNIINKEYRFSFTPVSKLQIPSRVTTGTYGLTGAEYGQIAGYHWVIGSFRVIADYTTSTNLTMTATREYPLIPTQMLLVGKDKDGKYDYDHNSFFSNIMHNDGTGYVTLVALLPGSYGQDGSFQGYKYTHKYDVNLVYFYFLTYDSEKKELGMTSGKTSVSFSPFLNVES